MQFKLGTFIINFDKENKFYIYNNKKLPVVIMNVSNKMIEYIKTKEGLMLKPYKDDDPHTEKIEYSIGYGHQIQDNEQYLMQGITKEKANDLFLIDLKKYSDAVKNSVKVNITQGQFDALTDFAYNLGIGALQKSTLLKLINENSDPQLITDNFLSWSKVGGKYNENIYQRRLDEVDFYFT